MDMRANIPADPTRREPESSLSIGAILVRQGRLRQNDIDPVLRHAEQQRLQFGESAVQLNLLTHKDIDRALARQFNCPVLLKGNGGVSDEVVAAYSPQSVQMEPIRALRSQLMIRYLDGAKRRSIAVISPDRGEGRSWVAANLAVALAQAGERTLLIDGDMRNPRQHKLFNIDNSLGLSALLTGRAGASTVHRLHPELRLFLVTAGSSPPNPQELLARSSCNFVFERFAQQYSVVIFDTPNCSETADAQIIAAKAGAAIMLARRNKSRYFKLAASVQNLREAGVSIIGSVLNEF